MPIIHNPPLILAITAAPILFLSGVIAKYFWLDSKFLTRKGRREITRVVNMFHS